jgi:protein phosphatase
MTTTLTVTYSAGDDLFFAHVGHSRAYLFRRGDLTLLTTDHTMQRHMEELRGPMPVEKRAQDLGHILTNALGAEEGHSLSDVERFRLSNGDCILLCTNGLTDMVREDQIADVLALRRTPREQCDILIGLAVEQGGEDNATVVLAQYEIPD